ncbi:MULTISPECIES: acyltransferase family protein [Microbacterium]|uniref:acyltransferase family protein n=1 Tax=Microbacterium TaxID=33882 RepID=UPI00214B6C2B|nr:MULTISPECIES: acyltransferase family protein [unclassified Microbacterium]MCR2814062.1 acyltransferase [Microbacterium sp. zg.Y1084]MDL5487787.1 acyltransferase family protein [Microbacterium sp. zg-Y1211]
MSVTIPSAVVPKRRTAAEQGNLRADIQALRALAVGAVLLYHLWPNRLQGGFVGVDVFFVISGFLITSHLLREASRTGTIRVARFWARRAVRLLPASLTVLLATAVAVVVLVPDLHWRQFLREIIASVLYIENWGLAWDSVDYLAMDNAASPTQHFWTLSVEEQFYFVLPLLLLVAVAAARRRRRAVQIAMAVVVAVAVVASFAYSVFLVAYSPSIAYFSSFTRAWEFGAGALLAFVAVEAPRWMRAALSVAGVAMIGAATLLYTADTPFPGIAAALPVAGTLLVLWAGARSPIGRVGRWRPVALLGHVSYAVYLWHWPLIVLLPFATGRPLSTLDKVSIAIAALALAWLSTRFIEEPVRFSPQLLGGRRPRTVALWSALGMTLVVAVAGAALVSVDQRDKARADLLTSYESDPPECFGAAAVDPVLAPCEDSRLAGLVVPDPSVAVSDDANLPECWGSDDTGAAKICTIHEPEAPMMRVLAVGDSHNNTLIGAYGAIAERQGWQMQVAGAGGCYLTAAEPRPVAEASRRACRLWRASIMERIQGDPPDLLVVTNTGSVAVTPSEGETVDEATVRGLVEAWSALPDIPIVAIRDNPGMTPETAACVAQNLANAATACARPRADALARTDGNAEAAALVPNAELVDLTEFYCDENVCPPVIGNVLVYRDAHHVTATWARTLVPYLEQGILRALAD